MHCLQLCCGHMENSNAFKIVPEINHTKWLDFIFFFSSSFFPRYLHTDICPTWGPVFVIPYDFWCSRLNDAIDHIIQSIDSPLKKNTKILAEMYSDTFFFFDFFWCVPLEKTSVLLEISNTTDDKIRSKFNVTAFSSG